MPERPLLVELATMFIEIFCWMLLVQLTMTVTAGGGGGAGRFSLVVNWASVIVGGVVSMLSERYSLKSSEL